MSFGFKEILVIAVIVILVFGTKKLRSLGSDLGSSVKGFKDAMQEGEESADEEEKNQQQVKQQTDEKNIDTDKTDKPA